MEPSSPLKKSNPAALLPIGVFLVLYLGFGLVFEYILKIPMGFYNVSAIVVFLIALLVAVLQAGKMPFNDKMKLMARGVADENVLTMCLIFLVAGAFSGAISAAGGVDSTVNLFLTFLPSKFAVGGLFLIGCFISLSMGSSCATIAALAPIAVGIGEATGFEMALCLGAVVSGAMFGDNLSMISDTTIAAVRTQGCEMKDKFRMNFLVVLPAAVVTLVLLIAITPGVASDLEIGPYSIWKVIPYLVVLVGALAGLNVFLVLFIGIVLSMIVGIYNGSFTFMESFGIIGEGMTSMFEISIISIIVACMVSLIKENGGISLIIDTIEKTVKGKRGAELGIGILVLLVDLCTANNTVAIVMAGPVAREIAEKFGVNRKRAASILDIFASVGQGIIPYGAQLLTAAALVGISPIEIIPTLYYPFLMLICVLLFIFFRPQKGERD